MFFSTLRRAFYFLLILAWLAVGPGIACLGAAESARPPVIAVEHTADGVAVLVDGELFTRYLPNSGARPVLWPVIGPTGKPMTRSYSVGPVEPGEEIDHPHHRSIWFGYEGLNGVDFWHGAEFNNPRPFPPGEVRHRQYHRADSDGQVATIITRNDYLDPEGNRVAVDERRIHFGASENTRWIDFMILLSSPDRPLEIHDTKEGAFALRVSEKLRSDRNQASTILNSRGEKDEEAWGRPAEWVDYSGEIDGEQVGIAIFAHPSSHKSAPRWHVRPYGLFAANPFGAKDYSEGVETGGLTVPAGKPVMLRHKIIFHRKDSKSADLAKLFAEYAQSDD